MCRSVKEKAITETARIAVGVYLKTKELFGGMAGYEIWESDGRAGRQLAPLMCECVSGVWFENRE